MSGTKRTNSHGLRIIATLIFVSVLLRVLQIDLTVEAQVEDVLENASESVLGIPFSANAIDQILIAIKGREALLEAEEERLENRRQTLNQNKADLLEKIDELTAVEQRLAATLSQAESAAEEDLKRLVSVYENMKPTDAAELFNEMTIDFAAGFISMMDAETAAAIMAELEPNLGHSISVIAAGRNVNAFKD